MILSSCAFFNATNDKCIDGILGVTSASYHGELAYAINFGLTVLLIFIIFIGLYNVFCYIFLRKQKKKSSDKK